MNLKPASLLHRKNSSKKQSGRDWVLERMGGRRVTVCISPSWKEGRKGEEARTCFTLDAQAAWLGRMVPGAQLAFLPQKGGQDKGRHRKPTVRQAGRNTFWGTNCTKAQKSIHMDTSVLTLTCQVSR